MFQIKWTATIMLLASLAWPALAHAGQRSHARPDCGHQTHRAWIARSKTLVTHEAPFTAPISEAASRTGHFECIRFTFGINSHGKPTDIRIADTTGSFLMTIEARRTLERYRFKVPARRTGKRYTLVFSGMVDKAPPPPDKQHAAPKELTIATASKGQTTLKSDADHYARAAGLPALASRPGFELRVWSYDYMAGHVTGTIVTNGKLRLFSSSSTYTHGTFKIKQARLSSPIPVANMKTLRDLLASLDLLNDAEISCPVLDGGSVLIDARLYGSVIRLSADNPWACNAGGAKDVMRLLNALRDDEATLCLPRRPSMHSAPWITGFWLGTGQIEDDDENEILLFHPDGTLTLYDGDYSPFSHLPLSHYTLAGDDIHLKLILPLEAPRHLTLHANRDRTELVLSIPGMKKHVTFARMTGKTCVTQQDLNKAQQNKAAQKVDVGN